MKGVRVKELENKDLNQFRDELFKYMVSLLNAQSKGMAKLLELFLEELRKMLIEIYNSKPEKGGDNK